MAKSYKTLPAPVVRKANRIGGQPLQNPTFREALPTTAVVQWNAAGITTGKRGGFKYKG